MIHLCPSLPVTINNPFSSLMPYVTLSITFRALSTLNLCMTTYAFLFRTQNPYLILFRVSTPEYSTFVGLLWGAVKFLSRPEMAKIWLICCQATLTCGKKTHQSPYEFPWGPDSLLECFSTVIITGLGLA